MGLMDYYINNVKRAAQARQRGLMEGRAELAQENAPQAQSLMGYNTMQTGADGLTTGMSSGLMADPNDPMKHLQMGLGLMAIPGYQASGQQMMGQATANQLGRAGEAAKLAEQRRYNDARIDMQRIEAERARMGMVGPFKDMAQYATASGGLRDDARAELAPFRQQMSLYNTVQDLVGQKGFQGMSIADDELFIKSYAKMLLPNEAVMTDDIQRIATSDKVDSVVRGLAAKVGYGTKLTDEEREQLWSSMYRTASSAAPRYEQLRSDYTERATRMYLNPADILNTAITMDARRFNSPQPAQVDPDTSAVLDEKARQQDPNMFDKLGDWWRN
jgi:hypothetical protein